MPEKLKSVDELLQPDSRCTGVLVNRETGESRPIGIEDFHRYASSIQLNDEVPEDIQVHFTTALHLGVYSWFVYRFTMLSQQQAYASLEWALRERLGTPSKKRRIPFSELLTEALDRGLLRGHLFRQWALIGGDPTDEQAAEEWLRGMTKAMREFRNALAHGTWHLAPMHWTVLRIVADAMNQLYPQEALQDSP
jgi:hypothetical protein